MRSYRSGPSKAFRCTAVPLIRATKKQFLLFSKRGIGTQSYPYESNRRDSYKVAVLWLETCCRCTEERGIRDKSKEGSTPFASHSFYLDRKLGVTPPDGFPFNLNNAVDHLLKKEFDSYRVKGIPHPLMVENGIKAVPFQHEKLDDWRKNMKGVAFLHEPTMFLVYGAVDELWVHESGELIVVDFIVFYESSKQEIKVEKRQGWLDP